MWVLSKHPCVTAAQAASGVAQLPLADKEGVPHTSRIGLAACAAGAQYTIPPTLAREHSVILTAHR